MCVFICIDLDVSLDFLDRDKPYILLLFCSFKFYLTTLPFPMLLVEATLHITYAELVQSHSSNSSVSHRQLAP